jgi:hypothetical protein
MQGKSLLIITGSMGAGKSSLLCEASDILALQSNVHAALDLDAFGFAGLPSGDNDAVMYGNFQCVCNNCAAPGVRRFLVARAIGDRAAWNVAARLFPPRAQWFVALLRKLEPCGGSRSTNRGACRSSFVARVAKLNSSWMGRDWRILALPATKVR